MVSWAVHAFGLAIPDSKVHGANMGPIWGQQDLGGPHVGPMNFAIWDVFWKDPAYLLKLLPYMAIIETIDLSLSNNTILKTIVKEESLIFVHTMHSKKTPHTSPLWAGYGIPFFFKMTWVFESALYEDW